MVLPKMVRNPFVVGVCFLMVYPNEFPSLRFTSGGGNSNTVNRIVKKKSPILVEDPPKFDDIIFFSNGLG